MGLTPNVAPEAKGKANSTTYSAIADGRISVLDGQTDVNTIRKDTQNTLNKLAEIFDKKTVEEKQELAMIFSQYANEAIHKISQQKGWKDGSPEKVAMHTLVGEITSGLVGGNFTAGALPAGINEAAIPSLIETLRKAEPNKAELSPDKLQWVSAVLGYAVNKMTGTSALTGAVTAQLGTKWNNMFDNDITEGQFRNFNDARYAMDVNVDSEWSQIQYNISHSVESEFESRYDSIVLNLGSLVARTSGTEYELAGRLLDVSLHGDGSSEMFQKGSLASNKLIEDPAFRNKMWELGAHIAPGHTESFYTSIEASGATKYAFGHIKLAVDISKTLYGELHVNGLGKDVYDYNKHPIYSWGDYINNLSYDLQIMIYKKLGG